MLVLVYAEIKHHPTKAKNASILNYLLRFCKKWINATMKPLQKSLFYVNQTIAV